MGAFQIRGFDGRLLTGPRDGHTSTLLHRSGDIFARMGMKVCARGHERFVMKTAAYVSRILLPEKPDCWPRESL